ncbi:MAG TPA: PQQ-dependent sugar dehydrogenase [Pyrinomonadaceae bacterium]
MTPRRLALAASFALIITISQLPARAATLPTGFTETLVASGLTNPTAMAFAPDGRLFVCEQGGQLRVIKNGALLATPFLSVTVNSSGERGLLGIAFDPNFAANSFLYVYYTATTPTIHNRVSRFTANGDVSIPGSEVVLLDLNNLGATNHNGGAMHFGPDGKLYIAVGENANGSNSQTLTNLLGKILRLNSDGTIPADNPFFGTATGNNRAIWALGLRNPYTFAFQPGTGRMFINDVGEVTREEINDGIAGSNYGWPTCEGTCSNPNFRNPLFTYGHGSSSTTGCAITGGAFYNPPVTQFPSDYQGKYFFADFCSGWIRRLNPADNTATDFATGIANPVDLQVASDGSLYYLARGAGSVFRVQYPANQTPPVITAHPSNQVVAVGETATFSVTATSNHPLSYQWQKNGVNIGGATSPTYTTPPTTAADNGAQFRCIVSNAFGSVTSNSATLTVAANTVQLGQSSYSLSEGVGSFNVTVVRNGNSGTPITVSYASSDTSALANCNPAFSGITGIASSRCDYITAVGTLRFAAGETTKTIPLIVVDDVHIEGPETFSIALSNPTGGVFLGNQTSASVTITDNGNDLSGAANPIDGTDFFVRQHYLDFLNREPDPNGFTHFRDTINNCQPVQETCDRIEVSRAIFVSPEFRDRGYFVYKFYAGSLARFPHYDEFMVDRARVSGFQTAAEIEQSKLDFIADFMSRQEFRNVYDAQATAQAFVDTILSKAGVTVPNRQDIINRLQGGRLQGRKLCVRSSKARRWMRSSSTRRPSCCTTSDTCGATLTLCTSTGLMFCETREASARSRTGSSTRLSTVFVSEASEEYGAALAVPVRVADEGIEGGIGCAAAASFSFPGSVGSMCSPGTAQTDEPGLELLGGEAVFEGFDAVDGDDGDFPAVKLRERRVVVDIDLFKLVQVAATGGHDLPLGLFAEVAARSGVEQNARPRFHLLSAFSNQTTALARGRDPCAASPGRFSKVKFKSCHILVKRV